MLRSLISASKTITKFAIQTPLLAQNVSQHSSLVSSAFNRYYSIIQPKITAPLLNNLGTNHFLSNVPSRSITKYSIRKGKRKSNKAVLARFYRLHWGIWIRRIAGCHKKLWKKSPPRRRRLRQHVFCNATQSRMLDKMVNNFWRRPKYYVDNPYNPYHTREEFQFTYTKPRPYSPPENV
ncbi:39S ribosomal protein L35, mitochondrial [Anthonomus grandis grandis]|uniref:39S ribosomal protein L35, mitochondrial n=1 Tax=Anthonomus grandis grandis TaxID=2921223 RepID=UPI002165042A|nr:39S ribosomal protein L35, mitochondrial [Anthonomus grandis grandis]